MSDSAIAATSQTSQDAEISPNNNQKNTDMETQRHDSSNMTNDPPTDDNDNSHIHIPDEERVQITTKSASATAAADSDRTNSSSITSTASSNHNNNNHNNGNHGTDDDDATNNEKSVSTSHVSFGSVHVHEHRMTLGTNPDVSYGVPVELAWSADASDMFDSIEEFEQRRGHAVSSPPLDDTNAENTNNGTTTTSTTTTTAVAPPSTYHHAVHRLKASDRDEIASRNHSRDSIVRVKKEVQMIQEQRHDSKKDKEPMNIIKEIRRQRMEGTLTTETIDVTTTKETSTSTNRDKNDKIKNTKKSFWSMCCP